MKKDFFPPADGERVVSSPDKVQGQVFLHNWLYSVLPITPSYTVKVGDENSYYNVPNDWFVLSGYCKNCNNAFSVRVPVSGSGELMMTNVGIPKTGCVPPNSPF
jgi:hypothetical protein